MTFPQPFTVIRTATALPGQGPLPALQGIRDLTLTAVVDRTALQFPSLDWESAGLGAGRQALASELFTVSCVSPKYPLFSRASASLSIQWEGQTLSEVHGTSATRAFQILPRAWRHGCKNDLCLGKLSSWTTSPARPWCHPFANDQVSPGSSSVC